MDGQGRVPSFEILTRDKGMAKSDTLSQGQTRGETDADDGQGLEASPPHRHLEALDANGTSRCVENGAGLAKLAQTVIAARLRGTSVECTLPESPPADIVFPKEPSGVIDYEHDNIVPEAIAEEARGQITNVSTFINPCTSGCESNGWPFQDAWDSMLLASSTEALEAPEWGWDWPWAQSVAQNDNGSALQQPSPALEQEVCSFPSEPEGSQSLDDTYAMFFWGEQPPVSEFLAMHGEYTAEGQHIPPPPTWLYPMSGFEWQDPTLEQPFEGTDEPLPTKLSPTPMQ
ncbi:hypothetical protein KXV98_005629 [Aspergillus fumigatus]|nr:hypothetical protein KXV98_005629 [Aspergillus fumigatus]KAJ8226349.1 hypothetical protein LV156_008979 [Aspergillus fumigatus]KAJ8227939.1 hypothetical protein LV160_008984 [Aspergillus fumigatus]